MVGIASGIYIIATISIFLQNFPTHAHYMNSVGNDLKIIETSANRDLEVLTIKVIRFLAKNFDLNCVAIVCDEVYLDLFKEKLFRSLANLPYVVVVVKQSEDLLSPNYQTLESLKLVRQEGCQLYIIFLANGVQASKLLKFGDRHRVLDTRAKYILLHDFRLFRSEYRYLWKRIINVVFLRHFVDSHRGKSESWFELSTVMYPPPTNDVLFPRRISTWKNDRALVNSSLFANKAIDLKGHLLKVVVLDHVPATSKTNKNTNEMPVFTGVEIEIIRTVSKAMNFKPKIYEPEGVKEERWGRKQLNGSFSGLLGDMVDGKADIALGNLHYTPYHLQLTDLTIPYMVQCLTFLTPEALTDNSWKTLILPFKLYMWVAVIIVLMMSGFIFFGLARFHKNISMQSDDYVNQELLIIDSKSKKKIRRSKTRALKKLKKPSGLYVFEEITNSILYTFGMLLVVSLPKLPPSWSIRFLTGWYWLYCILVVVSYRASMTAILANPAPRVTIDTMEQLVDSSISCGGWGEQSRDFFFASLDEVGQRIGAKFESTNEIADAVRRVAAGELAYYDNVHFLGYIVANVKNKPIQDGGDNATNLTDDRRKLHIMRECAINMPISIGLQKNSPLKPRFDASLRRIVEAGLVRKWLDDVMAPIVGLAADEESVKALMNLQKLYAGFVALAIGYLLGACTLIGEILHWKYVTKKDPAFDRYDLENYYRNGRRKFQFC